MAAERFTAGAACKEAIDDHGRQGGRWTPYSWKYSLQRHAHAHRHMQRPPGKKQRFQALLPSQTEDKWKSPGASLRSSKKRHPFLV